MDQIDLSELFSTRAEANDFLARITSVSELFFKTNFNLRNALIEQFGINKCDHILKILTQNNINPESVPQIKEFLFLLMSRIPSLPVISLTIAFEPDSKTLRTLSEWFFINMHKQVLFDITIDRSVIAGANITYNGKFFDFSIKSAFEKILQAYMERLNHPNAQIVPKNTMPQVQNQVPTQTQPVPQQQPMQQMNTNQTITNANIAQQVKV